MSRIIPNTYQKPNLYTDKLMHLLSGNEWKTLDYAARRIFGFHKDSERIGVSQFMNGNGVIGKDGYPVEYGTGLGKNAQLAAITALVEFGILIELSPNNASNDGREFTLQLDESLIRWDLLDERRKSAKRGHAKQTEAARAANADDDSRSVGQTTSRFVEQTASRSVEQTTSRFVEQTAKRSVEQTASYRKPEKEETEGRKPEKQGDTDGETKMDFTTSWSHTLGELKPTLPPGTFDILFRNSKVVSVSGGILTVQVQTAAAHEWLVSNRLARVRERIEQSLSAIAGNSYAVQYTFQGSS